MDGGPIALVQDGDRVVLDASKGVIDIEVDDASAYFDWERGVAGPLL
jgi:dihydroxyacid dehydratase/phosphogluconate dehydratase